MGSSLVSASAPKISLTNIRFSKIQAESGPKSDLKGGNLHVGNTVKLTRLDQQNRAIGSVGYAVIGLPKGVDDKKLFAFRLELTVEGIFEWDGEEPIWTDPLVEYSLLQSLYVVATLEVVALAQKLGFPNVELPLDLKISGSLIEKSSKKKPAAAKVAAVKVRAKPKKVIKKS